VTDIYWDSDAFLAWLLPEPARVPRCRAVIEAAEQGQVRLITSAITLSEVVHLKGKPRMNDGDNEKIRDFFRNPYILIRNLDRRTADLSRELIWKQSLNPKDAIHLATAIFAGVKLMHTFDAELIAASEKFGDPKIKIEEPSIPQQMALSNFTSDS
jgi:predicted nucleic acid-binding protein